MRGFLKGSETVCYWGTFKAVKPSDLNSYKKKIQLSHSKVLQVSHGKHPLIWMTSPRWRSSDPDSAATLQRGAEAGECNTYVSGQQGLPLRLESVLEGGRQQHHQLGGEWNPWGAAEGRPLQLEQHPEVPCRPVEGGVLCDLWGHPGLPDSTLRDTEERPVFPVLTSLAETPILASLCQCFCLGISLFSKYCLLYVTDLSLIRK